MSTIAKTSGHLASRASFSEAPIKTVAAAERAVGTRIKRIAHLLLEFRLLLKKPILEPTRFSIYSSPWPGTPVSDCAD